MREMKPFSSYTTESVMKVTRTTHKLSFREGQTAEELLNILTKFVPKKARIIEFDAGDSEVGEWPYIRFQEEFSRRVGATG